MSLGKLGVLPPEARTVIWQLLIPRRGESPCWGPILFANRTLKDEIYKYFYGTSRLVFSLHGDAHSVDLEGPYCKWHFLIGFSFSPPRPEQYHHLFKMPLNALKQICLDLTVPDPQDPGQLLLMLRKVCDTVLMLSQSSRLPAVDVSFKSSDNRSWGSEKDVEQMSLPVECISDLRWLVQPFSRLRRASSCSFQFPPEITKSDPELVACCQNIEKMAITDSCFDDRLSEPGSQDYDIRLNEIVRMLQADVNLDYLTGPAAAFLRRERYKYWERYEDALAELPFSDPVSFDLPTWATARGRRIDQDWLDRTLQVRYIDMRTWCPYDYVDREVCINYEGTRSFEAQITLRNNKCQGKSTFGEDLWLLHYPNGIPPFGSNEYWENRDRHRDYYAADIICCWAQYQWEYISDLQEEVWDCVDKKMRKLRPHMFLLKPSASLLWMARSPIHQEFYPPEFEEEDIDI